MEKIFSVSGLHCSACAARVQKALAAIDGVEQVQVDLASATVKIKSVFEIKTDSLNTQLEEMGDYHLFEKH